MTKISMPGTRAWGKAEKPKSQLQQQHESNEEAAGG